MPKRPQHPTRAVSSHELLIQARGLLARLVAACSAFDKDENSDLGMPNMAGPLRVLVCSGRGNQLLQRICGTHKIPVPEVWISKSPAKAIDTTFSVGSVPNERPQGDASPSTDLVGFLSADCVALDHETQRIRVTWDELLRGISEKRGYIHSDDEVPEYFQALDNTIVSNVNVVHFLFRSAAWCVAKCAAEILRQCNVEGVPEVPPARSPKMLTSYYFEVRGIPWPSDEQRKFEVRLELGRKKKLSGDLSGAKRIFLELVSSSKELTSLFYIRLRAISEYEAALVEADEGNLIGAQNRLGRIFAAYSRSPDSGLSRIAESAFRTWSNISR